MFKFWTKIQLQLAIWYRLEIFIRYARFEYQLRDVDRWTRVNVDRIGSKAALKA